MPPRAAHALLTHPAQHMLLTPHKYVSKVSNLLDSTPHSAGAVGIGVAAAVLLVACVARRTRQK